MQAIRGRLQLDFGLQTYCNHIQGFQYVSLSSSTARQSRAVLCYTVITQYALSCHAAAAASGPVDHIYSRIGLVSGAFFPKGWGNLGVVNLAEDLKHMQSWPPPGLKVRYAQQRDIVDPALLIDQWTQNCRSTRRPWHLINGIDQLLTEWNETMCLIDS